MISCFVPRTGAALAVLGLIAPLSYAQAQTQVNTQQAAPVIITASGLSQTTDQTLSASTLITRDQIERSGARDLPSLLRQVAGVEITQAGGAGKQTSVRLRGGEARHTLVLVDGVAINNNNFGAAAIEQILASQIDRIEVVRGNVSALYGSNAVGGVIQIFTRGYAAKRTGLEASLSAGTYSTSNLNLSGAYVQDDMRLSGAVSHYRTDGFSAINTAQQPSANPDNDEYRNTSANVRVEQRLNAQHRVSAAVSTQRGASDYDNAFGAPTDWHRVDSRINSATAQWQAQWLPTWRSTVALASSSEDANGTSNDRFSVYQYRSSLRSVTLDNQFNLTEAIKATAAVEQQRQRMSGTTAYPTKARRNTVVRTGLLGQHETLDWQINLRRDDYSDFGTANTYLLGAGYRFAPSWRVNAVSSTAFNAPTFNDLYFPGFSNPLLKPERNRSHEIGLQYGAAATSVRLTWFDTRYSDKIGFDSVTFKPINTAKATNRGLELQASTQWAGLDWGLNLTGQDVRDSTTGARLPRHARHLANLQVGGAHGALQWQAALRANGNRNDGRRVLDGYEVLDLRAQYALTKQLNLQATINNASNKTTQDIYGYNNPGRTLQLGLSYRM